MNNDQLSTPMSNLCYCKTPLVRIEEIPGWTDRCYNCCLIKPDNDQYLYVCQNEQCLYKRMSGDEFWVCQSCYDDGNPSKDPPDGITFALNKLSHSISTISYV